MNIFPFAFGGDGIELAMRPHRVTFVLRYREADAQARVLESCAEGHEQRLGCR